MVLYGLVPARESLGHISYVTPIAGDGARTHDSLLPLLSHNTVCVFRVKEKEPLQTLSQEHYFFVILCHNSEIFLPTVSNQSVSL